MYQTEQQPAQEMEQVVGTVMGVVAKGGNKWQAIVTPDGSDRTRNLWTDDQNTANYINSQIGARLAFACRISRYSYQGQPTSSLWITAVGAPQMGTPQMAGPPMQQPQQNAVVQPQVQPMAVPQALTQGMGAQGYDNDPKQGKIHRQTATKVAAILLTNLPSEQRTMTNLLALAERLVAYYDNGLPAAQTVEDLMSRAMPQGMEDAAAQGGGYDQPTYDDSDIPF